MILALYKAFYSIAIHFYHSVIGLISPFNEKSYAFTKGRLNQEIAEETDKTIWFHCASLGEFEQAKPLINWCYNHLNYPIIITFFSPSGYVYKCNYALANRVYYLPKDTASNAKHFIQKINPAFVFFIKYEFWYYFLNELDKKNIPTYLVAGIFKPSQLFFKSYGVLHKEMLNCFTHLFVQDEDSLNLLQSHGFKQSSLAKDTRFDTVKSISILNFSNDAIETFIDKKSCIVAGSTWLKDEVMIKKIIDSYPNLKFIIAPHNVNQTRIKQIKKTFAGAALLSEPVNLNESHVLIIDSIGKLALLYRYATLCYIGGGFGVSVHNVLEAAVYGKPLIYGPNYKKSKEAVDLVALNAAKTIRNDKELKDAISYFLSVEAYTDAALTTKNYVRNNTGGTEKIIEQLKKDKLILKE